LICAFSAVGGWIAPHDNLSILKIEQINDKRVERIWRREGLKVPPRQPGVPACG
jgi:hypothetical protein